MASGVRGGFDFRNLGFLPYAHNNQASFELPRFTRVCEHLIQMNPRLYLEIGQQEATQEWWDEKRHDYQHFVSEFVEIETGGGGVEMAARLKSIQGVPRLLLNETTEELAAAILDKELIPPNAAVDASHIAVSAVHKMVILLTWNCKHIHNIAISRQIERICARAESSVPRHLHTV